ncbi:MULTISPECIES: TetR/AcrR family transcriptional regulator [Sphingobium]|jgi:AcrR family transcriptional regulator|uniref:TetR family transcriptional regulator n=2 Tax=Sphingobium fuliginis (strain ATCC 27551) TaxID=336203 RepID=A0A4V1W8T7_SPHSA|nr:MULTISPECIES: TetR/AcrR family transcriptional regulator [Sphingobium]AJR23891.1 TetR family transcriptional regulator [Sphingobium sp. YBL2]MCB4858016.1 TetR/AcrR family transcriptional regulator [Sphingobium sp. PNB]PNP95433.1 TetR family transcriptional regulator [Sphingobium sp. SA916]QDC39275.1 TetR/AcrR family transcriptional regulator [Sphingobium fuliginis ATCC 27551]QOT73563.1 TetR family transcriptional regulator [Sphingobium fuliginis]
MTKPVPPSGPNDEPSSRRRQILEIAAQLFAKKGYRGTSMRDIGEQAGVLGGSLYHHIRSKDALFVELHNAALDRAEERIAAAVRAQSDPWARLYAACATLLDIQLAPGSLTTPMMNDFREVPDDVREQLIARRDRFEGLFRSLVEELPLPAPIDRSIYRNLLLAQLNATADWYRPGKLAPAEIAAQIVAVFRHE